MKLVGVILVLVHEGFVAMISIQVQNTFIDLGRTDIDIRCFVNDSDIERIGVIQLLRSDKNIVSITERGVFWQDKNLQGRAAINGSGINGISSNLHIRIDMQKVTKNDGGAYFCKSTVLSGSRGTITVETGKHYLNITETKKVETNDGYQRSQHNDFLVLVTVLINYISMLRYV
ncbi:uncharacterized protein LOC144627441 isoform X2 [Crassostrea virginica]